MDTVEASIVYVTESLSSDGLSQGLFEHTVVRSLTCTLGLDPFC